MDFNKPQKNNDNNKKKKKDDKEKVSLEFRETNFDEEDIEYFDYLIELPLYPNDFEHCKGSKKITDDEINMWIEECIIALESDKSETYATSQAGDTKLVVLRMYDDAENYHYIIEVFRDRHTIEIYPEEL